MIYLDDLQSGRLHLRRVAESDLELYCTLFSDPAMLAHRPDPTPDSRDQCQASLTRDMAHWREHGFGRWTISVDGSTIGLGGLSHKSGFAGINVSYHIGPAHWGGGLATEFVNAAVRIAFRDLAVPTVYGLVRPVNVASIAVLRKCGFLKSGSVDWGGAPTLHFVRYP